MKKYILYIFAFFLIVIVIDLVFGAAANYMIKHANSGAAKRITDLCERNQYDILIMGSSKAHHNYMPQVFSDSLGMSCYNAGYDGNGIILAYGILNSIDNERIPKLIVYDVKQQFDIYHYSGDGDYTRYYQSLMPLYGSRTVDEIIGSISRDELLKLHSSLYRTNGDFLNIILGYIHSSQEDNNLGFSPVYGVISNNDEQEKDYSNEVDSLKIQYFKKFVTLTKEKDIQLVVVFSPEYNTPFASDLQPIKKLCQDECVTVLDYFNAPTFQNKELFIDHCHMNVDGAMIYSAVIAKEIKELTDKKNTNNERD